MIILQRSFETITIQLHFLISNKKFDLRIDIHYTVSDRYDIPTERTDLPIEMLGIASRGRRNNHEIAICR